MCYFLSQYWEYLPPVYTAVVVNDWLLPECFWWENVCFGWRKVIERPFVVLYSPKTDLDGGMHMTSPKGHVSFSSNTSRLKGSRAHAIKDKAWQTHQSPTEMIENHRISNWPLTRATAWFATQTHRETFETVVTWTPDEFFNQQSRLCHGGAALWGCGERLTELRGARRENTFLLTAWLKLDHQMASLHLSPPLD